MKIAILANNYCPGTLETVRCFKKSQKINYVIIETSIRKSLTKNEIIFNKSNLQLERILFSKKQRGFIGKVKEVWEKKIFLSLLLDILFKNIGS